MTDGPAPSQDADGDEPAAQMLGGPTGANVRAALFSAAVMLALYQVISRSWWLTLALVGVVAWRSYVAWRACQGVDGNVAHNAVRSMFYLPTVLGVIPAVVLLFIHESA